MMPSHMYIRVTSYCAARLSRGGLILTVLFLATLPFVNPWIRGDGVGYYAYLRALVIQHDLNFEKDWQAANPTAREAFMPSGQIQYTVTGHYYNHFSVGPAILWAPFFVVPHAGVILANRWGARIPSDGFSRPYRVTIAIATAAYGWLALLLSFSIARRYFNEAVALLATIGIWLGSSLPVYMYFNPSWSHALSAFAAALFLWYWLRTRIDRTLLQWAVLGVISGLLVDVYYPNGVFLSLPLLESMRIYWKSIHDGNDRNGGIDGWRISRRLLAANTIYLAAVFIALLPTFVTRKIIFGGYLRFGSYTAVPWRWTSPALVQVLLSSDHGLLIWTPILILAVLGLALLWKRDKELGTYVIFIVLAFYYVIASYPVWDGISSFGNRFFVSLTPLFIVGLAASVDFATRCLKNRIRGFVAAASIIALLVLWNFGFIFQWGTQLIPSRGPISWSVMVHNQYAVVPRRVTSSLETYFLHRGAMMQQIESVSYTHLRAHETGRNLVCRLL